jgi:monooxygenase
VRIVGDEEVEKNFTPKYRPWQQRIAFVPDGDLFHRPFKSGKADRSSPTTIERFVPETA